MQDHQENKSITIFNFLQYILRSSPTHHTEMSQKGAPPRRNTRRDRGFHQNLLKKFGFFGGNAEFVFVLTLDLRVSRSRSTVSRSSRLVLTLSAS